MSTPTYRHRVLAVPPRPRVGRFSAALICVLLAVTACSAGPGGSPATAPTAPPSTAGSVGSSPATTPQAGASVSSAASAATSSAETPAASTSSAPAVSAFNQRCTSASESFTDLPLSGSGMKLAGATLGEGDTVAILLHQATGDGMCGFASFAESVAKYGSKAVLIDTCGAGRSVCPTSADHRAMVALPVEWARRNGAKRIVLVGASAGGSIAVHAAAHVKADAVVDLSGPITWQKADLRKDAATLTMPTLLAFADQPDAAAYKVAEGAVKKVPGKPVKLLHPGQGHGYDLVGPGGTARGWVLGWIKGEYSA